ncbi:MAG: segregation/condensation protein A [Bryobacterales bacterium]|nr:segregation/condensation protein A [Bryobacterales bacterium]
MPTTQPVPDDQGTTSEDQALRPRLVAEATSRETFVVSLEQYEGPLDALLELIKEQQIDILDIPVARLTEQYLESLRRAESLNVELNAEFVLMAATLVHIKSKMLLPTPPKVDEDAPADPREDLVKLLLEREKFVQAAQMLGEKRVIEENVWTTAAADALAEEDGDAELQVSLFDLVQTFGEVLERLENQPVVEMPEESVSVASRILFLKNLLQSDDQPVRLRDVLLRQRVPRAVIATFLALLEMVKAQAIEIRQNKLFGEVVIRKHANFDQAFRSGELLPASDSELEYSA